MLTVTIDLLVMKGMGIFSDFFFNTQFLSTFFSFQISQCLLFLCFIRNLKSRNISNKQTIFPPVGTFKFQSLT